MSTRSGFLAEVNSALTADFRTCTDCGICSAVCPARAFMDFGPMRVVQLTLMGAGDRLLSAPDAFACTNCGVCTQYCPVGLPVAELFDFLRDRIRKSGHNPKFQKQAKFAQEVLKNLGEWGRLEPQDLGWAPGGSAKRGGLRTIFGRGEKRQPLNVIRDVPSVFDFLKKLRGEWVETEPATSKDKKGKRR